MADVCEALHMWVRGLRRFAFPFDPKTLPSNGLYLLFENGEEAHGGARIVRVGTHTGKDQLPSRLQQHFVNENKDRSIFRKNIGRCLLKRNLDRLLPQWELDLTTRAARERHSGTIDLRRQGEVEREVTGRLQKRFSFVVVPVEDPAQRRIWESRLISTLSLCEACRPSAQWLGLHSPKRKIRESGLWLEQELYKQPLTLDELDELKGLCPFSE